MQAVDEVEFYDRALSLPNTAIVDAGSAVKCKPDADSDGVTDVEMPAL